MPEWWTYTLSDFQQFSTRTYYRLFELHNAAIWPAHGVALAAGVAVVALLRRAHLARSRGAWSLLAASWLWVAFSFHATRYATINRLAPYFAAAFVLQALLLVWNGVARPQPPEIGRAGLVLFLFALFVQPFLGLLFGRGWRQLEVFGIAPDPTVVGTLGALLAVRGRTRWALLAIPILWCIASGATLAAMRAPGAWLMPLVAAAVAALALRLSVANRRRIGRSPASNATESGSR